MRRTLKLGDIHAEGISLFENTLTAALNEVVKSRGEGCHALAQVVEAEIDRRQAVRH